MRTLHLLAVLTLLAGAQAFQLQVHAAGNDKATLQDLMAEGDGLNKALVKATVVQKKIAQNDQELKGSQAR
jgi:hypothetical protein